MPELGDPWQKMAQADIPPPEPIGGSVRVDVEAGDLNFADILQCQGTYQVKLAPPFTPGMAAAGIVNAVGEGVTDIAVGQRVVGPTAHGSGGFAEQALVLAAEATVVSSNIDPRQAVAMHTTYGTAWFALYRRGQLKPGETVLVLAAAGGVGSAAVELAKLNECWVVAAAGAGKADACRALGADEVIDYGSEDLYERVMALTDGRGVDVVYDPVGGNYFDVARRLVAWEGRLLVIGFASGTIPSAALNHVLVKNYSIVGVHMGGYWKKDPTPFYDCYGELYRLLEEGKIKPLIDRMVGFDGLPDALADLNERRVKGRLVFVPEGGE
jgi:NADPH2:quinone reductase